MPGSPTHATPSAAALPFGHVNHGPGGERFTETDRGCLGTSERLGVGQHDGGLLGEQRGGLHGGLVEDSLRGAWYSYACRHGPSFRAYWISSMRRTKSPAAATVVGLFSMTHVTPAPSQPCTARTDNSATRCRHSCSDCSESTNWPRAVRLLAKSARSRWPGRELSTCGAPRLLSLCARVLPERLFSGQTRRSGTGISARSTDPCSIRHD
jgi:hypothetical protein